MKDTYECIEAAVVAVTAKAVKLQSVENPDDDPFWIPISVLHEDDQDDAVLGVIKEFNIATWFVEKEGLPL